VTTACVSAAAVNPGDKFELLFKNLLERLFVERMDQNEDIFVRFMNDVPFQKVVTSWMAEEAYRRLRTTRWLAAEVRRGRGCGWSKHPRRSDT
jgi:type I restriction enzyme R subunit